jgi:hypothetical protein
MEYNGGEIGKSGDGLILHINGGLSRRFGLAAPAGSLECLPARLKLPLVKEL